MYIYIHMYWCEGPIQVFCFFISLVSNTSRYRRVTVHTVLRNTLQAIHVFLEVRTHLNKTQENTEIPLLLSQLYVDYNPKVFTFILSLSEGQAGKTWEPYKKSMFFLPQRTYSSFFSYGSVFALALVLSPFWSPLQIMKLVGFSLFQCIQIAY
jgi:hypothetical protein